MPHIVHSALQMNKFVSGGCLNSSSLVSYEQFITSKYCNFSGMCTISAQAPCPSTCSTEFFFTSCLFLQRNFKATVTCLSIESAEYLSNSATTSGAFPANNNKVCNFTSGHAAGTREIWPTVWVLKEWTNNMPPFDFNSTLTCEK